MGISGFSRRQTSAVFLSLLVTWVGSHVQAQGLRVPGSPAAGSLGAGPAAQAASTQRQTVANYVVAMINSEPLTNSEVAERGFRLGQQIALQGGERPNRDELLQLALGQLINEKLQLQLATQAGIKIDETALRAAELNVAAQNRIPLDEVLKRLADDGISREQFRQTLRNQLVMTRLREREVESRVKVSENEVEQRLRELQSEASTAEVSLNIAQILVAVPEGTQPAQLAQLQDKAQKILARARSGEDFANLARELSQAPEASSGGALGLRPAIRYPDIFVEAVSAIDPGGVTGPIRSGAGFHVLKLLERERQNALPTKLVQSRARHILLRLGPQLNEADALRRLEEMRRSIDSGTAEFVALAKQHSQDGSARDGGDLGWTSPGQFVPEFEEVMNALAPGQISVPTTSRFGVHLIQLIERRDVPVGERERRGMVRNEVHQRKADEAYALWLQEIRGSAFVQMREPPQ